MIEIVTLLARALGVIAPVGGGELKIRALFFDSRLQRGALATRLFERRRPNLVEKSAHRLGRFRHRVVELVGGEILVAEQPRAFVSQLQDFSDDGAIVRLPAVLAPLRPGVEGRLAQIAPRRPLQKRLDRGTRERDAIFAAGAALSGESRGGGAKTLREPVERVFIQQQQERGFIGQHILRKSGAKPREPFDDGRHARALIAFEPRAGAQEVLVGELQHARLLGRQSERPAPRI